MADIKISQLSTMDATNDTYFLGVGTNSNTSKVSIPSIIDMVKKEMGFYKNPLKKCGHCGQWGAVYCECIKCGAPIDPES